MTATNLHSLGSWLKNRPCLSENSDESWVLKEDPPIAREFFAVFAPPGGFTSWTGQAVLNPLAALNYRRRCAQVKLIDFVAGITKIFTESYSRFLNITLPTASDVMCVGPRLKRPSPTGYQTLVPGL